MELFDRIIKANVETGDILGIQYGIVAAVDDPLGLQRIQVYDQAKGGIHKSDWLIRGLAHTQLSPPIPKLGEMVIFGYIMGDPHHGCYLGMIVNQNNKPVGADDDLTVWLGTAKVSIVAATGDITIITEGKLTATVKGETITIEATEELILKSPKVTYDSPTIDMGTPTSVKISGKQVTTIDAVDSRGDTLTSKGW
jgi:phage baseplate assembly protein gpV